MSCASYLGSGHRIEFFGEDGTLVLDNPGADYMRGFRSALRQAARQRRSSAVPVDDPIDAQYPDGRIAPVSRLAKRFFDAIEDGSAGYARLSPKAIACSMLIDAARRSHQQGVWIDVAAETAGEEMRA